MRLSQLRLPPASRLSGGGDPEITGVSHDSRTAGPGDLWAALPGARVHGAEFAAEVLSRGVSAVLTDEAGLERMRALAARHLEAGEVAVIVAEHPRAVLGDLAAQVFGTEAHPDEPLLLGVTGTNGKTTTVFILDALLRALGRTTGLIGTVATEVAGVSVPSVRTTPEAPELHGLFAQMRAAGVEACSMEVSSHALAQHRVDGAHFASVGFTNLSRDHLDFHPTMEDYFAAKAELFTPGRARTGVVVVEDEWGARMAAAARVPVRTLSEDPAVRPDHLLVREAEPGRFRLRLSDGAVIRATAPLPGAFNVTNTALALAMLHAAGESADALERAAAGLTVTVPGRMERVSAAAPLAVVDYSHTPDALDKVLAGLDGTGDPLVVVMGAGGDRDREKRPHMGRAAARRADVVIVTDDNPRSEDPAEIRAAVLAGAREALADGTARARPESVRECAPRGAAIELGVRLAGAGGTLLVAGKGHETGQEIAGTVHPFDDRARTRDALTSEGRFPAHGRVQD
ncbi:UDP-N-acetylmuramoyl-L-alanyl-D-glutamate--2,6-diaminopimelate ligase [Brevibacterium album]|uniref:UDP-N-acetylmuramoyl-L-alanyl-D-glutamate--2, 6-diaminopimelate ligase n=1 Tax=Brevibacterium album TaxID=417948 RepID=UPI00042333D0|nr:UDP-N-acetylmuramoyl-L-alanyl-D-glutamate--2,6-diaminopimelate ligase [Brevibacterium album]